MTSSLQPTWELTKSSSVHQTKAMLVHYLSCTDNWKSKNKTKQKVTNTHCLVLPAILRDAPLSGPSSRPTCSHVSPLSNCIVHLLWLIEQYLKIQNTKWCDPNLPSPIYFLLFYLISIFLANLNSFMFFIYVIFSSVLLWPVKCQECLYVSIFTCSDSSGFSRFN